MNDMLVSTCRHPPKAIYKIGDVEVMAASLAWMDHAPDEAVVLNCTGSRTHELVLGRFDAVLREHVNRARDEIVLPWADMEPPPVKAGFWRALFAAVKAEQKNLLVHCYGGHGRTGTALAAIMIEACGCPPDEAIAKVRAWYCKSAIETTEQEKYLRNLGNSSR